MTRKRQCCMKSHSHHNLAVLRPSNWGFRVLMKRDMTIKLTKWQKRWRPIHLGRQSRTISMLHKTSLFSCLQDKKVHYFPPQFSRQKTSDSATFSPSLGTGTKHDLATLPELFSWRKKRLTSILFALFPRLSPSVPPPVWSTIKDSIKSKLIIISFSPPNKKPAYYNDDMSKKMPARACALPCCEHCNK